MYEVTKSVHGLPSIQATELDLTEMHRLRSIIMNPWMNQQEYILSKKAGAFLQGYDEESGWILIEFWNQDYQPLVDFINKVEPK